MGKKSKTTVYYDYYISGHWGFCHGPVDSVEEIYFKEKPVLDGTPLISNGSRAINKPDLFGGYEREGGIVGTIQYLSGIATQVLPFALATRLGLTPETAPAYRGIFSLALHGDENSDRPGAIVSSNYPNVPSVWARVRRASQALEGVNQPILVSADGKRYNTNPACLIYECLLDPEWGMGGDKADQYAPSFVECASLFADENFGLSMLWTKQSSIESFVQEILSHVKAVYYVNPYTGLGHLKALRNDYDPQSLNQYSEDDFTLINFRRKLWGETTNEISVTWTDPEGEKERSVTYQDPGNIAMQGDIVAEARNYYGIRDEDLAVMVANRDLVEVSAPLATATISINRMRWKEMPGDCIRFRSQQYNIENTIMRVMDIDWGKVDDAKITVSLMEDVFGLGYAKFGKPNPPEWEDPDDDPDGPQYDGLPNKFFSVPYTLMQQELTEEQREDFLNDDRHPEILVAAMVWPAPAREEGGEELEAQDDLQAFVMNVPDVDTTGELGWLPVGEKQLTGKAALTTGLIQEVESTILYEGKIGGDGPEVGRYAILSADEGKSGIGTEKDDEWIMFVERIGPGFWRVKRGVMDTIPHVWSVGTHIFFLPLNFDAYNTAGNIANIVQTWKLQARTSLGVRKIELTGANSTINPDRPYKPYRPANVTVDGVMFGYVNQTQDNNTPGNLNDDEHRPRTADEWDIPCEWSNRNRMLEETLVFSWDGGTVPAEAGQTTEIIVLAGNANGEEIGRVTGITGTSFPFNLITQTKRFSSFGLKFVSRLNGFESMQGVALTVGVYPKGFGSDFGYMYGGWPGDEGILTEIRDSDLRLDPIGGSGEGFIDTAALLRLESRWKPTSSGRYDLTQIYRMGGSGTGIVG